MSRLPIQYVAALARTDEMRRQAAARRQFVGHSGTKRRGGRRRSLSSPTMSARRRRFRSELREQVFDHQPTIGPATG